MPSPLVLIGRVNQALYLSVLTEDLPFNLLKYRSATAASGNSIRKFFIVCDHLA